MDKVKVNFLMDDKIFEAEQGKKLSKICEEAGYPLDLVCGGNGRCGKCTVQISVNGIEQTVLSCKYEVNENIEVKKIHNLANRQVNVLTSTTSLKGKINPNLRMMKVSVRDIFAEHCGSFMGTIKDKYKLDIEYPALQKLSKMASMFEPGVQLTFVIYKDTIIDVLDGSVEAIYGLAVDIGSTTCAGYIYNIDTAEVAGIYSALNAQTALGADVISRIAYAINQPDGTRTMREKVVGTLNSLLRDASNDGIDTSLIYNVVLCGNSTMQHLFLGLFPKNLGNSPFASTTHDFVRIEGSQSGLDISPLAKVIFLPLLGGFVGADTTSVLIGIEDDGKKRLVIDLGTNGELAVGNDNKYIIASTACGPALEGAGLSCGMRAAEGAIEHYKINEDQSIDIQVIGGTKPVGICGSGIIDILGELIRVNVINKRGKMYSRDEYETKFGADKLSERLQKLDDKNIFVLASAAESASGQIVYFSQGDVRQIQLAKAAIASGCIIIMQNYGMDPKELDEICLAGAFGNYLSVEQAQFIGLLPQIEGVPIRSIGNGAGTGVQVFLLDQDIERRCKRIQRNSEHTELNFQAAFKDTYFDQMLFKNGK